MLGKVTPFLSTLRHHRLLHALDIRSVRLSALRVFDAVGDDNRVTVAVELHDGSNLSKLAIPLGDVQLSLPDLPFIGTAGILLTGVSAVLSARCARGAAACAVSPVLIEANLKRILMVFE